MSKELNKTILLSMQKYFAENDRTPQEHYFYKVVTDWIDDVSCTQSKQCKHVKREGESCTLNDNCTYPDCQHSDIEGLIEKVKESLLIRGFSDKRILNNRGLIGAAVIETLNNY